MEPAWDRQALLASPLLHTVRPFIEALPADRFPDCDALNELARRHALRNANGRPIRFVPPEGEAKIAACDYEGRAYRTGEVLTRERNWHDFYNALAWLAFPRTKASINALHIAELERQSGSVRSVARDVLTLFDEGGMIVACSRPALIELLRDFKWKELFVAQREAVRVHMRFYVVGHAVHEKALAPYRGIIAHAIFAAVDEGFHVLAPEAQLAAMDAAAAAQLRTSPMLRDTSTLQPLPILGIPRWWPQNESPTYYDDTGHFRPGRTRRVAAK